MIKDMIKKDIYSWMVRMSGKKSTFLLWSYLYNLAYHGMAVCCDNNDMEKTGEKFPLKLIKSRMVKYQYYLMGVPMLVIGR